MNKDYSVLILGNFENVYIVQYVKHLKRCNPLARLYFWGYKRDKSDDDRSFLDCYDEYYLFDINYHAGTSIIEKTKAIIQLRKHFRAFAADKHFDYINIHYVKPEYYFLKKYFKEYASKLVLTPWGSDVYGLNRFYRYFIKGLFDSSDYITNGNDRFSHDFQKLFNVPEQKMVFCEIGIETIEYIMNHKNLIDTNEAKKQLGIDNHYIITCGYKAQESHQHLKIIDAIHHIKNQLPQNLLLLFPLTYPQNPEYIQTIKNKVEEYGLKAIYFDKFLDIPHLFLLRQATDVFIHIQPTDASSASLWEYILCEKKVINGAWLQYPELEKNGIKPYFEVDSLEHLEQKILDVYLSDPIKIDKELLNDFEKKQWKVVIKDWDKLFSTHLSYR